MGYNNNNVFQGNNIFQSNWTSVTLHFKKKFISWKNRALFCPQNKYGCAHILKTRSSALTQISIAKVVCILCSQLEEISKNTKCFLTLSTIKETNCFGISKHGDFSCSLTNKVYVEYHLLIVKMHVEYAKNEVALKNLNSLCHVEFILKLLLLVECVHVLIKFAHDRDVFVLT